MSKFASLFSDNKAMKENKRYKIDVYGLKNGLHEYCFDINDELFESFGDSLIDSGDGTCTVTLLKKETMMELSFLIQASTTLICDRSNEPFEYEINSTDNLIVKYGEDFDDSNEEMWIIPSDCQSINIQQLLYEYLALSIPMKKLHPRYEEEECDDNAQLEWVYTVGQSDEEDTSQDEEDIDPRWAALKNIKKN